MASYVKERMMAELNRRLDETEDFLLLDITGITAVQADALRRALRQTARARLTVLRNVLTARALEERGRGDIAALLQGPCAMAYGGEDPANVAKILITWARKSDKALRFWGGRLEGKAISAEQAGELARIPPKDVLLGLVLGAVVGPLRGFLSVLEATLREFLSIIEQLKDQAPAGTEAKAEEPTSEPEDAGREDGEGGTTDG